MTSLLGWVVIGQVRAATLEQVRVMVGREHARVLLVFDEGTPEPTSRTVPRVGSAGPRALVMLPGTGLSEDLAASWPDAGATPDGPRRRLPVDERGVRAVTVAVAGHTLQVAFDLDEGREVTFAAVGDRALLVDLRVPDAPEDETLPGPEVLAQWLDGVSLERRAGALAPRRPRIVIDAGHGGHAFGAVGPAGTHEADVALDLALWLGTALEQRLEAEVLYTRTDDRFLTLSERAALARGADAFISVHANAVSDRSATGIETYYLDRATDPGAMALAARENGAEVPPQVEDLLADLVAGGVNLRSKALAVALQRQVLEAVDDVYGQGATRDLGVKTAIFTVLARAECPAVLFEASFISNPLEEARLRSPQYQRLLADALAEGVEAWLGAR